MGVLEKLKVLLPPKVTLAFKPSVGFQDIVDASVKACGTDAYIGAVTPPENVLAPTMVCVPVDINPGLVASAAANVNVLPLIFPPLAYELAVV